MDTLALAIACATIYIACHMPQPAEKRQEQRVSRKRRTDGYARQLKASVGRVFEFGLTDISLALGHPIVGGVATVTATLVDCDDEWALVSFERSGKTVRAMIRYTQIESLTEVCPRSQ